MIQVFVHVFKNEGLFNLIAEFAAGFLTAIAGVFGLYRGLSASILRQATYSTTRFGTYEKLKDYATGGSHGKFQTFGREMPKLI